jgi:hypothetical protein
MTRTFDELKSNANAPISQFDGLYDQIIGEHSSNLTEFNKSVQELKALCLQRGIDHSRYSLLKVSPPKQKSTNSSATASTIGENEAVSTPPTVEPVDVERVIRAYAESFYFLPYTFIRAEGDIASSPERLIVLYGKQLDEHSIESVFKPERSMHLSRFLKEQLDPKFTWLIFILFHSSDHDSIEKAKSVLDAFPYARIFCRKDYENKETEYWKKDRSRVYNETLSENPCLLVHDTVDAEREYLIKNLFGTKIGFLVCATLKSGFSGSKVFLLSPVASLGDNRKFVLKISEKKDSKLVKERDNYKNYVEPFWNENQQITADWIETSRYHVIRYPFASVDTISNSISFTEKYKKTDDPQKMKDLITRIFDHKLHEKWRGTSKVKTEKFKVAFGGLFQWSKAKSSLEALLKVNPSIGYKIEDIDALVEREISFVECISHGDFHTDNIQVQDDPAAVFLIDFGETERFPAGVDHVALEASIRFRLIDYAIDPNLLEESDLSNIQNFDSLIKVTETSFDGDEINKLIKTSSVIRERFLNDFLKHRTTDELRKQYLYCLLALSLRQVSYPDLNRRYILLTIGALLKCLVV